MHRDDCVGIANFSPPLESVMTCVSEQPVHYVELDFFLKLRQITGSVADSVGCWECALGFTPFVRLQKQNLNHPFLGVDLKINSLEILQSFKSFAKRMGWAVTQHAPDGLVDVVYVNYSACLAVQAFG